MMHALLILIFLVITTYWLGFEFPNHKTTWQSQWKWAGTAVILPIIGSVLSLSYEGKVGNFLLHTIGGGVAAACMFRYFTGVLNVRLNWRLSLLGIFMFASALGVVNELAEYGAELLRLGTFSFDTQDTWRDLTANTIGAVVGWIIISFVVNQKVRSNK